MGDGEGVGMDEEEEEEDWDEGGVAHDFLGVGNRG